MRATDEPPDGRRCIPVRLPDIPLDRRISAARHVLRDEDDDRARQDILLAALFPSNTVYWIAA